MALNKIAIGEGLEDINQLRQDSTVVETNIHYPTNNSLVGDCIKDSHRLLSQLAEEGIDLDYRDESPEMGKYGPVTSTPGIDRLTAWHQIEAGLKEFLKLTYLLVNPFFLLTQLIGKFTISIQCVMNKKIIFAGCLSVIAAGGLLSFEIIKKEDTGKYKAEAVNAGLTLPQGFKAVAIADNLGSARHLAVTPKGDIYVHLGGLKNGKGIVVLHDNGDKAGIKTSFGAFAGTGICIKNGYLYASSDHDVFRYKLNSNEEVIDPEHPEKIVGNLVTKRMHQAKAIALDNKGYLYVNIGAYSNICSEYDPQKKGCPVLDSAAGIWRFKADKLNQTQNDGIRYATGLRNVVGLDWNQQDNQLFVMQHGRDALHDLFPKLYTVQQSALLPAECMYALKEGDNAGWPYLYFDDVKHKKIQGPEYGGDGGKEADAKYINPVAAYPGHLAPDGLLFYTGNQFPEKYKNGAFIAFHGSWNRAPEPQAGYFVVFQPFKNGRPAGKWEVFADGFAGTPEQKASGLAEHRPCGLAQGPDGSLYVSDDNKGTIYKITYKK